MGKPDSFEAFLLKNFCLEVLITMLLGIGMLSSQELSLYFLCFILFAFLVSFLSYKQFFKAHTFQSKIITLCIAHFLIVFPILFVFCSALGGVSMAVVDGVAGNVFMRYSQYLSMAIFISLESMIIFLPWSCLYTYTLKKDN